MFRALFGLFGYSKKKEELPLSKEEEAQFIAELIELRDKYYNKDK